MFDVMPEVDHVANRSHEFIKLRKGCLLAVVRAMVAIRVLDSSVQIPTSQRSHTHFNP